MVTPAESRLVSATWGALAASSPDPISLAREKILRWVASRSDEALPSNAYSGASFSLALGHCDVISGNGLWALRFDTADEELRDEAGIERRWRTEAVIAEIKEKAIFTVRLSVVTAIPGVPFFRSSPSLVRELAEAPGLIFDGLLNPQELSRNAALLFQFLSRKDRLPVLAVADNEDGSESFYVQAISKSVCGFAHVVRIPNQTAWDITKAFGRKWSVFNGALRLFMPGVSLELGNYRDHPIWLKQSLPADREGVRAFTRRLLDRLLTSSVSRTDLDELAPSFNSINSHLRALQLADASTVARKAQAEVAAAKTSEDRVAAQHRQIDAMRVEADSLRAQVASIDAKLLEAIQDRDMAYEFNRELEQEIDRLKAQIFGISARNRSLEAQLAEYGEARVAVEPLVSFEDLEDWSERHFAGRLVILPKAARAAKKAVYEDVDHISSCLTLLASHYVDMRRGRDSAAESFRNECERLRVEVSDVGEALQNHRYRQQFLAPYQRGSIELDLHLAPAPGTSERGSWDPKRTYRIYFAWDSEQEVVVIGSLPGHLTTSLTH
ncbi:hypothetical protein [Thermomonas haemolytica]|uniref:hypothetical protein n=1 Tax=Thermomonas haemolytica TaxID=141949 RepID=UPI00104E65C9|nr:hypothetical protein [Thermomonas haemolytica]